MFKRYLWRLRAPASKAEVRRSERVLATARVFLAISPIISFLFDPVSSGLNSPFSLTMWGLHLRLVWALLAVYIAHSVVVLLLFRFRHDPAPRLIFFVHAADVAWPILITLVAGGENGPFARFFVFVLLAAGYRWGLRETVATALAWIVALWGESWWLGNIPAFAHEFTGYALVIQSAYLLVMAVLIGYLAEHEKRFRAERVTQNRLLASVRVELGLSGTLQAVMNELMQLFDASHAVMAAQEVHSVRVFLADVHRGSNKRAVLQWLEAGADERERFLQGALSCSFGFRDHRGKFTVVGLNEQGWLQPQSQSHRDVENLAAIAAAQKATSVAAVDFSLAEEWHGRIFLFDPEIPLRQEEDLRFLQELMQQVGPAVYNVFLLRRLRQRAGAVERARMARELHDGAVQSLIAMEMQVDVLRRQVGRSSPDVGVELRRIQHLLREEVLKLREMMQHLKSIEVDASNLVGLCVDTVERFQRETGVVSRFVPPGRQVDLDKRVCRELARILQEALVNVRKHSGARNVLIRLVAQENNIWKLIVEDDGEGFEFSGRLELAELDEQRKGPLVIKERVRLIEGQLAIESVPGSGTRLEVTVNSHLVVGQG